MYKYTGITTHNLKDISVAFKDHELIFIGGVSGSGKSSLAFDTIAAISENEYGCLVNDNRIISNYKIKEYSDVLVASTLKQLNYNVNPRSTILTYFGLYSRLASIMAFSTGVGTDHFSLNGPSRCKTCNGLGYVNRVDELLVVDYGKSIKEMPFKCWNASYKDFFTQLLHCYCKEEHIDENKRFGELSPRIQEKLLRGKGATKYKISYSAGGRKRSKTSTYIGPIIGLESDMNDMFGLNRDKYASPHICPDCHGSRLNAKTNALIVHNNTTVQQLLTFNLSDVHSKLDEYVKSKTCSADTKYLIDYILRFISICERLNISYLNLSRGISTLSGGELQRLRIAQLMMGKIRNLLIVMDEPTASLSPKEIEDVIAIINDLKKHNTIIVVDHNEDLRKIADRVFLLGPGSGSNGGRIIKESEYLQMQKTDDITKTICKGKIRKIALKSDYVNYASDLSVSDSGVVGLCGASGVGKTTILRDVLPYQIEDYKYITQKPIKGNRLSTVASYTALLDEVKKYYEAKTQTDKKRFSIMRDGACPICSGRGSIMIGDFYDEQLYVECEACSGTGYAKQVLEITVDGLNIYDFLNRSVDDIISDGVSVSPKFQKGLLLLNRLGLGHLTLNQKISTLSGGENQRIKLFHALGDTRTKCYGLDEPTKGLGPKETCALIGIIYEIVSTKGKTFIVSEHNPLFLESCTVVNELKSKNGKVFITTK